MSLPFHFVCLVLLSRLLLESRCLQTIRELIPIATLEFHAPENCEILRHKLDKSNIQNGKRIQLDEKVSLRLVYRAKTYPVIARAQRSLGDDEDLTFR
jgi:hypothetical protein